MGVKIASGRTTVGIGVLLMLVGCKTVNTFSQDYDRHRMSMVRESETQPGVYLFEAQASGDLAADDQAAEAVRMQWLETWMETRGWCQQGYDVIERKPFGPGDINFYNMDLRYSIKCKPIEATPEDAAPAPE